MKAQSPFKFLDSYTKEDRDIFFGRETEVEEVYTKIFQSKILLVYGASGTGKSSLISCGLGNKFQDTDWLPVGVRRGTNINDSVRQQLEKNMLTTIPTASKVSLTKMLKSVYLDHFKPIYIVFDQFEELFIFGDKEEWMQFVASVREVLDSDMQVKFVFIIRGEYLELLTEFESVLPEVFANRIRIEKMTRTNAVNCITGPCKSFDISVEEHFPENLLAKLSPSKTEIELTYLQVFLDRIYKKAKDKANGQVVFSNKLLDELGNVGDVLSQFLDEQIELIPDSEKALALLKAFVSTDATKKQITAKQAADFVKTIGQDLGEKQVDLLIQELVNRRILKDKDEAGRYELRHDSIAAKIFEKITNYERDLIEVNQFITYAFGEHEKRAFLLNESDLAYIAPYESKLNLKGNVKGFIEKSRASVVKTKRGRKRIIAVALTFGILAIISLLALIYAFFQQTKANKSRLEAEVQSVEALKQKDLAEKQTSIAEQKQVEADKQTKIAQEQSAIALIQKHEADKQRLLANAMRVNAEAGQESALNEKAKADAAKIEAEKFSLLATQNAKSANEEKEKATRFRMLAIAQAMGAKATQLQDAEQKALVAQQAFVFNKQYNGYEYQADIYNGLYAAYEALNGDQFNTTPVHKGAVKGMIAIAENTIITAGADGKIFKTNLNVSPAIVTLVDSYLYVFQSIAISPDKKWIAFGTEEGKLLIYDAGTLKKLKEVTAPQSTLWTLEFDNLNNLYSAGSDQRIMRWNIPTSQSTELIKMGAPVNSLSYSRRQNALAAALVNGDVALFQITDQGATKPVKIPTLDNGSRTGKKAVTKVIFNSEGSILAVGKEDGSILIYDIAKGEITLALNGHRALVSDLQFNSDDHFLLSASYDGTSMLWNMRSVNDRQVVLSDHNGWVLQACFDPDGRDLITADAIGTIRYFSLNMDFYAAKLCNKMKRNMNEKEWSNFVGSDIPYAKTCPDK